MYEIHGIIMVLLNHLPQDTKIEDIQRFFQIEVGM